MKKIIKLATLSSLVVLSLGCESNSSSSSSTDNSANSSALSSQSSSTASVVSTPQTQESSVSNISSLATQSSSSEAILPFTLTSSDINEGEYIDVKFGASSEFSGDSRGKNISPQLQWTPVEGANSYAIEMIDLDFNNALHWSVINIPASATTLPQGVAPDNEGMETLENDFGEKAYTGPFPPATHNYKITIYAVGGSNILSLSKAKGNAIDSTSITFKFEW